MDENVYTIIEWNNEALEDIKYFSFRIENIGGRDVI